jgi:hypothetical protein
VGLRDLFDSDGRSKADLRAEIQLRDAELVKLGQQLSELRSRFLEADSRAHASHEVGTGSSTSSVSAHDQEAGGSIREQVAGHDQHHIAPAEDTRSLHEVAERAERKRQVLVEELAKERQLRRVKTSKSREAYQALLNAVEVLKKKSQTGAQSAPEPDPSPEDNNPELVQPPRPPAASVVRDRAYYSEAHRLLMEREDSVRVAETAIDGLLQRFGVTDRSQVIDLPERIRDIQREVESLRRQVQGAAEARANLVQERDLAREQLELERQSVSSTAARRSRQELDAAQIQIKLLLQGQSDELWQLKRAAEAAERKLLDRDFDYRNMEIRVADLEATNVSLKQANKLLKEGSVSVAVHKAECAKLLGQINSEKVQADANGREAARLGRELATAQQQVARLTQDLAASLSRPVKAVLRVAPVFADQVVLTWLLQDGDPDSANVPNGWLGSVGEGPWPDALLRKAFENLGYEFWQIPDEDLRHLVVGREGWTEDELLDQIDASEGKRLRIYSQEMFLAKLMTGRDPFDSGDNALLVAFAKGHPALEFLCGLSTPWPTVSSRDTQPIDPVDSADYGVAETPLHKLGYRVGSTSELTVSRRRQILADCFQSSTLEFTPASSKDYIRKWGRGSSAQRLYRMAVHIRWLADGQGRDPRKPQARQDWINDLEWLRKTYYPPVRRRFTWP